MWEDIATLLASLQFLVEVSDTPRPRPHSCSRYLGFCGVGLSSLWPVQDTVSHYLVGWWCWSKEVRCYQRSGFLVKSLDANALSSILERHLLSSSARSQLYI